MIEILNICLHQNSIVIKFLKILKIREIFCKNPRIIFVLFYDVHKENMFTTNLEDYSLRLVISWFIYILQVRFNPQLRRHRKNKISIKYAGTVLKSSIQILKN